VLFRSSTARVHLVGTGGHRVSTAGQLVGATADAVSSGVGVLRTGGAVVSAANAGETTQARRPIATAPTRQQPVVLCIRILPSEMGSPRQDDRPGRPAGDGVPTGVIITPKPGPVKTRNFRAAAAEGENAAETPELPQNHPADGRPVHLAAGHWTPVSVGQPLGRAASGDLRARTKRNDSSNATSRGGAPDPPRTCVISPLGINCRAVGQETPRARGYVAL